MTDNPCNKKPDSLECLWFEICRRLGEPPTMPAHLAELNIAEIDDHLHTRLEEISRENLTERVLAAEELLRRAGHYEGALQFSRFVPRLIDETDPRRGALLSRSLQSEARSLDALGRIADADRTFAIARHVASFSR